MPTMYHTNNRLIAKCQHKQLRFETLYNPHRDDSNEFALEVEMTDEYGDKKKLELTKSQVDTWLYMLNTMREYM